MRKIPLSGKHGQGKFALVDDEDFEYLSQFNWRLTKLGYVVRDTRKDYKLKTHWMHRVVMGVDDDREGKVLVDHKDGDRLNNQKENLRFATKADNNRNSKSRKGSRSQYKGVCYNKEAGKWCAKIGYKGKRYFLGYFTAEAEAALAYNKAALDLFGEYARLNVVA